MNSSVLTWPDQAAVDQAVRTWAAREAKNHPGVLKFGYFGSYARGDAGVGSDVDLIAIVAQTEDPFERRSLSWDLSQLAVPAEILVYTLSEFERLIQEKSRFARVPKTEMKWVYSK